MTGPGRGPSRPRSKTAPYSLSSLAPAGLELRLPLAGHASQVEDLRSSPAPDVPSVASHNRPEKAFADGTQLHTGISSRHTLSFLVCPGRRSAGIIREEGMGLQRRPGERPENAPQPDCIP